MREPAFSLASAELQAVALAVLSLSVAVAYAVAFVTFGSDAFSRAPWVIAYGLVSFIAATLGIPAIRRSTFLIPTKLLLFASHLVGLLSALLPVIGFALIMIFVRGPINPG